MSLKEYGLQSSVLSLSGGYNVGLSELLGRVNEHMKHLAYSSGTITVVLTDRSIVKIRVNSEGLEVG